MAVDILGGIGRGVEAAKARVGIGRPVEGLARGPALADAVEAKLPKDGASGRGTINEVTTGRLVEPPVTATLLGSPDAAVVPQPGAVDKPPSTIYTATPAERLAATKERGAIMAEANRSGQPLTAEQQQKADELQAIVFGKDPLEAQRTRISQNPPIAGSAPRPGEAGTGAAPTKNTGPAPIDFGTTAEEMAAEKERQRQAMRNGTAPAATGEAPPVATGTEPVESIVEPTRQEADRISELDQKKYEDLTPEEQKEFGDLNSRFNPYYEALFKKFSPKNKDPKLNGQTTTQTPTQAETATNTGPAPIDLGSTEEEIAAEKARRAQAMRNGVAPAATGTEPAAVAEYPTAAINGTAIPRVEAAGEAPPAAPTTTEKPTATVQTAEQKTAEMQELSTKVKAGTATREEHIKYRDMKQNEVLKGKVERGEVTDEEIDKYLENTGNKTVETPTTAEQQSKQMEDLGVDIMMEMSNGKVDMGKIDKFNKMQAEQKLVTAGMTREEAKGIMAKMKNPDSKGRMGKELALQKEVREKLQELMGLEFQLLTLPQKIEDLKKEKKALADDAKRLDDESRPEYFTFQNDPAKAKERTEKVYPAYMKVAEKKAEIVRARTIGGTLAAQYVETMAYMRRKLGMNSVFQNVLEWTGAKLYSKANDVMVDYHSLISND